MKNGYFGEKCGTVGSLSLLLFRVLYLLTHPVFKLSFKSPFLHVVILKQVIRLL